jgi:hypothetical protein
MTLSTLTIAEAIDKHGIDVLDHLDRSLSIPILSGIQFQGDIAVVPATGAEATTPVPTKGLAVVRGENGGNTHSLHGEGDVRFDPREADTRNLSLGRLTVAPGATAYLAHPEHAYSGIAPGTYDIRRQREQAEELRMVTD